MNSSLEMTVSGSLHPHDGMEGCKQFVVMRGDDRPAIFRGKKGEGREGKVSNERSY
jgi:hypothetical protein